MRVQDLLTMSTGHQDEPPTSPDRMSAASFLAQPVPHKPGTHFKYNTAATFMASAIVQKRTGQTVLDYLQPRLFGPLGIEAPRWDTNHEGISLGGYGLFLKTEDIAKFGQLYLQKGHWNGRQLLPAAWVEAATSRQVSNGSNPSSDWDQGYGYQFWRCRNGAYRGDGKPSQMTVLLPQHPVARGLPGTFVIPQTEMYGEPFHVPPPDEVVLEERWATGEWFRSGSVWRLGAGRVFYFRPGHETYPVYFDPNALKVVANAVQWLGQKP
jgi:CubicO group peptidase (beta-lactamase class C family)